MWVDLIALAQQNPNPALPPNPMEGLFNLLPFIVIPIIFFLVLILPARRSEEKARRALTEGLKKNDKVLTTSGIYGTVVAISEKEDEVTVRVDDNVRLKMLKASIARNLSNEEAAKAAKDEKATKA